MQHSFGSESSAFRYRLKKLAKNAARAAGYEVRRTAPLPLRVPGITHAEVVPVATYSPWLADEEFLGIYEAIKGNTLVDQYRCYEIWQLVAEAAKLPAGDIIEIGVWKGGTGALIAKRRQLMGIDATVNLCDTFTGVVKAGSADAGYTGGEHADTAKDEVVGLCGSLNLDRVRILEGIFPEQTGHLVSEGRFRFCHIDVDVYQSARDICEWIWPRLVPGGLVVYDDYGFYACAGVTKFVNMERQKPDRIVIHNLNGHAVVVKTGGGGVE